MPAENPKLLAIFELGGYPNFMPLYQELGFRVQVVTSQRQALKHLKKDLPDLIVAEYNFQSDFRDRSSNLETLMSRLEKFPQVRIIVLHQIEHESRFRQFCERFRWTRLPCGRRC